MDVAEVNVTADGALFNFTSSSFSYESLQENERTILSNELAGQVYAYRINDTHLALGTRRADVFGAAVGIGVIANGTYQCFASNPYENQTAPLDIIIGTKVCMIIIVTCMQVLIVLNSNSLWTSKPFFFCRRIIILNLTLFSTELNHSQKSLAVLL